MKQDNASEAPAGVKAPALGPTSSRRAWRERLRGGLAPLLAALLLVGPVHAAEPDTSRVRDSDEGRFVVSVASQVEPVPLNALHAWIVHVERPDGTPVNDATIAIDGGMPMHDHGLPTAPRVTETLGEGDYLLEGMKFQMPGHWVVTLAIDAGEGDDSVTFELML